MASLTACFLRMSFPSNLISAWEEMGLMSTSTVLRLCLVAGTLGLAIAFSAANKGRISTVATATTTKERNPNEAIALIAPPSNNASGNNNKNLESRSYSNSVRGREPSFLQKQRRRFTVFTVAARVYLEYKWAQRQANRRKRRLELDPEDPNSDDHPDIQDYWSQVHKRNAEMLLGKIQKLEGFWVKVGQYLSSR